MEIIVTAISDEIAAALTLGDRVELRGFGLFSDIRPDEIDRKVGQLIGPGSPREPAARNYRV